MIRIRHIANPSGLPADVSADAWAQVTWHDGFTQPDTDAQAPPPAATSFAMAHDDEFLLIAVKCGARSGGAPEDLDRRVLSCFLRLLRTATGHGGLASSGRATRKPNSGPAFVGALL